MKTKNLIFDMFLFVKNNLFLLLLLVITVIVGFSGLLFPWSLVDDGYDLLVSQEFTKNLLSGNWVWFFNFEKDIGRFRLGYWFYQWLTYLAFGLNVFWYRLFHLLLLITISFLIYYAAFKVTNSKATGFLSAFLYLLFSPQSENWLRLGPAEIPLAVYTSLILALFAKLYHDADKISAKKLQLWQLLFILTVILAILTKETSAVLSVWFVFTWFLIWKFKRNSKKVFLNVLAKIILSTLTFSIAARLTAFFFGLAGGYGGQYTPQLSLMLNVLREFLILIYGSYGKLLIIGAGAFFIFRFIGQLFRKKGLSDYLITQLSILTFFIAFLAVQLPWPYPQGRYLTPALAGLTIFLSAEFIRFIHYLSAFAKIGKFEKISSLSILVVIFVWLVNITISNGKQVWNLYTDSLKAAKSNQLLVKYLAQQTPANGRNLINVHQGGIEFMIEIGYHHRIFYNRADIKVDFYKVDQPLKSGDLIATWSRLQNVHPNLIDSAHQATLQKELVGEWLVTRVD